MIEDPAIRHLIRVVEAENSQHLNIYIHPERARRLYSLIFITEDFIFLRRAVRVLLSTLNKPQIDGEKQFIEAELDAQWYGIITMYARCFTKSWDKNERLDETILQPRPELLPVHTRIMYLRDKFVAHRDASPFEKAVVIVTTKNNDTERPDVYFTVRSARITPDYHEIESYLPLFDFIETQIPRLIESAKSELGAYLSGLQPSDYDFLEENIAKNLILRWDKETPTSS